METYQIFVGLEILVIIILGGITICLLMKQSKNKRVTALGKEKVRENELNNALVNPVAVKNNKKARHFANIAYDVAYHEEANIERKNLIEVQLMIETALSTRKYLVQIEDKIQIGSGKENDIEINDREVANIQCFLMHEMHQVFLRNAEKGICTKVKRKEKVYEVEENPPQLRSGDEILLGKTTIKILSIG